MSTASKIQPIIHAATDRELFSIWVSIMAELRRRKILRSDNTPTGDYAEWLVSQTLGLKLEANAKAGYDAVDALGNRYQIKARRLATEKTSRQLSAIRNLNSDPFDQLIVVIFGTEFQVLECWQIPIDVVRKHAIFTPHVNAHRLHAQGSLLLDHKVTRLVAIEELFH